MPGTPHPVLGSDGTTLLLSFLLAFITIFAPVATIRQSSRSDRVAVVGSIGYALAAIVAWFGVRRVFYHHVVDPGVDPTLFALIVGIGVLTLTVQSALPLLLYARRRYLTPLLGLFAVTVLIYYAFLRVGGESDPLGLYAFAFGPLIIAALGVLAAIEAAVRMGLPKLKACVGQL